MDSLHCHYQNYSKHQGVKMRSVLSSPTFIKAMLIIAFLTLIVSNVPDAYCRWKKEYTPSGYPETLIQSAQIQTIKDAISNDLTNLGYFIVKDEGGLISFESSKKSLGYRPITSINLIQTKEGIRVIMRRFLVNPSANKAGSLTHYFSMDSTIENTNSKKPSQKSANAVVS